MTKQSLLEMEAKRFGIKNVNNLVEINVKLDGWNRFLFNEPIAALKKLGISDRYPEGTAEYIRLGVLSLKQVLLNQDITVE